MLYEKVLEKKQELCQITSNPIMDAFDLELCKELDKFAKKDEYVKKRLKKCFDQLVLTKGMDFNEHYKSAFENYNEAVVYYFLKQKGFEVDNIPEMKTPTPDFEVTFDSENYNGQCDKKDVFIELKTLSFAEGNIQYKRVQSASMEANVKLEEQRKHGARICFAEYEVTPLGDKANGLTAQIEILIGKLDQNIKKDQFTYEVDKETILWVDLSQYGFPSDEFECLPIYPNEYSKSYVSGMLWMVAFGCDKERIYKSCEFEGKPNIDKHLNRTGILNSYEFIKGIIFSSGVRADEKKIYGFYRYKEQDSDSAMFISQACDFYNDDMNSNGYILFKP